MDRRTDEEMTEDEIVKRSWWGRWVEKAVNRGFEKMIEVECDIWRWVEKEREIKRWIVKKMNRERKGKINRRNGWMEKKEKEFENGR